MNRLINLRIKMVTSGLRRHLNTVQLIKYFILISFVCACSSKDTTNGLVHPDPAQLPGPDEISFTVDLKKPESMLISSMFEYEPGKILQSIGTEDGDDEYFIYNVRHLKTDQNGNIYLTKGTVNSIYVYDSEGTYLYSIGRSGSGPAEFTRIINFDFDSSYQQLYVLDMIKIEIFSLVDGRYEYGHTIMHELHFVEDLCALDDNIYVSGFYMEELDEDQHVERPLGHVTNSKPIHRFSRFSDTKISSFGASYKSYSHNPILGGMLSEMMLDCNKHTGTVAGLQKNFAHIYGYDASGHLKWISRIDGLDYQVFTEADIMKPNARLVSSRNDVLFTPVYNAFRETDSEYSVLRISYAIPAAQRPNIANLIRMQFSDRPVFHTVYIDTRTGELSATQMYRSEAEKMERKEIFGARKNGRIFAIESVESGVNDFQIINVYTETDR